MILCSANIAAQDDKIYHWHPNKDAITMISSGMLWGGTEYLKTISPVPTPEDIMDLNSNDIWAFDRATVDNLSMSAKKTSDYLLYTSVLTPFTHFIGKKGRKHSGVILGMTLEAFLVNDGITSLLKTTTSRFRPYTYNPEVPIDDKQDTNARYSFASGHASNTAVFCFFSAKVFNDLYPESKWKTVVWVAAATLPAVTSYLRTQAGRHFPTDVITGYAIGASVGFLVPHFHKISTHDHAFNIGSFQNGIVLTYNKRLY
ncbi:MAG: phosphatase PAP2 family protein [Saprospiraceae bacterium]|nr:phosphatase PAP2 family protein [Saprospiraceae bacterium]